MTAAFDGGSITSNAGALLLRQADRSTGLFDRVAAGFTDHRGPRLTEHSVRTLVAQRPTGSDHGFPKPWCAPRSRRPPIMRLNRCLRDGPEPGPSVPRSEDRPIPDRVARERAKAHPVGSPRMGEGEGAGGRVCRRIRRPGPERQGGSRASDAQWKAVLSPRTPPPGETRRRTALSTTPRSGTARPWRPATSPRQIPPP